MINQKTLRSILQIQHEAKYVEFLRKALESESFKSNVSKEAYIKTKNKYDKAKLKLKMMREGVL